jgi:SAM-dependent methyltransferase
LVLERLADILPPPPATVLDVGGGSGAIAVPLASQGYRVTVLDPSHAMLDLAGRHAADAGVDLGLVPGGVETLAELAPGPFDAVCCHAVLLYLDDPGAHLLALRGVVAAGATLSLLEKNRAALSMRPGLRGEYAEAIRVLDDPLAQGNLGIPNRARSVREWAGLLDAAGWRATDWVGIRLFSDIAPDAVPDADFDRLLALEREAGRREPYRSVARLVHIGARAV